MKYEWDTKKNTANKEKHGVSFKLINQFDWARSIVIEDSRQAYNEVRFITYGLIDIRVYICVFTVRNDTRRIISLRKANRRETLRYMETTDE